MIRTRKEIAALIARMTEYLLLKVETRDWHGVADAAMDLRELEVELRLTNVGETT